MTDFVWTDERVEQMRTWAAEGLTTTEIVARFCAATGAMPTRNAIIGKCRRIGIALTGGSSAPAAPPPPRAPALPRPVVPRSPPKADVIRLPVKPRPAPPPPSPRPAPKVEIPPPAAPTCAPVALADLELRHCRYPVGDLRSPGFGFCGETRPDVTRPYCRFHAAIAYVPSAERERVEKAIDRVAVWGGR